jgi:hypothetical protein
MIKIDMVSQLKKPALKLNTPEKSLEHSGASAWRDPVDMETNYD